jgi:hypothetical protein
MPGLGLTGRNPDRVDGQLIAEHLAHAGQADTLDTLGHRDDDRVRPDHGRDAHGRLAHMCGRHRHHHQLPGRRKAAIVGRDLHLFRQPDPRRVDRVLTSRGEDGCGLHGTRHEGHRAGPRQHHRERRPPGASPDDGADGRQGRAPAQWGFPPALPLPLTRTLVPRGETRLRGLRSSSTRERSRTMIRSGVPPKPKASRRRFSRYRR